MASKTRQIVLATDLSEDSLRALQWSITNLIKASSDTVHVVHVAKLKDETPEIHHGPVGTSFHYHESSTAQTKAAIEEVKEFISHRINTLLDKAGIEHETHLFLEGENAPASAVAAVFEKVYNQVKGDLIIASRSNKTWRERWFLGSVAECLSKLPHPLILVTTEPPNMPAA